MKKIILIFVILLSVNMYSQEQQFEWETNFTTARASSKSQDKPILVYFTDNSNTEANIVLNSEFFQSKRFKDISNKMVLLLVDVSKEIVANQRLNIHYNKANTFPTLVVLDANGYTLGDALNDINKDTIGSYFSFLDSKIK
jgi:thioredoxin-related protein